MDPILDSLNDKQREAVLATEGYYRIIAGAGSGKTKTLTHRFAYLVKELGIPSNRILCVTFTNKAASEMRDRVKRLLNNNITDEYICTFHSFCVKVLRREIQRLGYQQTFGILDTTDQKALIKDVFEELGISQNDGIKVKEAMTHIEKCKNREGWQHLVELLIANKDPKIPNDAEILDRILIRYLVQQRKNLSLDFNDLISFTLYLLQTDKQVLDSWSSMFSYIMVDETQDNSIRQWTMLSLLSQICRNLFVVGDPDQAIYSFRGARPDGLINFDKSFFPCTTIVLDRNYRSTPTILSAANDIISHNRLRVKKDLYTTNTNPGNPIEWFHGEKDRDESQFVATKVQNLLDNGTKADDIAVLFRVSALSRSFEQAFIHQGIKYQVFGGTRFFERQEIKDTIAYLTMAETPDNDMAFLRTINYPSRKLGKTFVNRIRDLAKSSGKSLFATLLDNLGKVKEVTRPGSEAYVKLITQIQILKNNLSISDLTAYILEQTGLMEELRKSEDTDRLDNVIELQSSILSYENEHKDEDNLSLNLYLQDISLYTNVDVKDKSESIKMMTIHQSKGLEFPYVFLVGCNEGVMPSQRCVAELGRQGLEEERRLAYVAVTRAKNQLYITDNEGSYYGGGNRVPSRFIFEINDSYIHRIKQIPEYLVLMTKNIIQSEALEDDSDTNPDICAVGARVNHKVFGPGIVEKVDVFRNEYMVRMERTATLMAIRMDFEGLTAELVNRSSSKSDKTDESDYTDRLNTPAGTKAVADRPTANRILTEPVTNGQPGLLSIGQAIIHPLFGPGKIISVDKNAMQYSVYIEYGGFTIPVNFDFDGLKSVD